MLDLCKPKICNSFLNDKILDKSKLKAFPDDNLNIDKMTTFFFDRVENTVGKGENAGYQHFLLFFFFCGEGLKIKKKIWLKM